MDDCDAWEVVCPDGRVRHYAYGNQGDAEFDAGLCSKRCRLYPKTSPLERSLPECSGGAHHVRAVAAPAKPAVATA
jgi:hypothetical protein